MKKNQRIYFELSSQSLYWIWKKKTQSLMTFFDRRKEIFLQCHDEEDFPFALFHIQQKRFISNKNFRCFFFSMFFMTLSLLHVARLKVELKSARQNNFLGHKASWFCEVYSKKKLCAVCWVLSILSIVDDDNKREEN
jgi:hypothetical protein